ncbi:MAG: biotin carboxylase N-terminal domain-containing protein [Actinomycetota bacterium]
MPTLLVANRGEIAIRIFRTAKRMGMRTVAVYSDADADAPHMRAADTAVHIGPAPATQSYLDRDRILQAARDARADLVHPGYGFLAEDDRFARACEAGGLTFVGPPADVLARVGDKAAARELAETAGVPVLRGFAGADQSDETIRKAAEEIGFPVLIKPAGGGGGKGMSFVDSPGDIDDAVATARRIARAAFDDDRLILERYIEHPRHVEVQVLVDAFSNVVHLGERDCSLQRRHQKILEESPAPNLDQGTRSRLCDAAVAFARAGGYVGAGTCEFLLVRDGEFGFIEMNARLQVEHAVTEAVTGLDLVELQLRIAMGEQLPFAQDEVRHEGHAVEVRVYAEDPNDGGFLPQAGRVEHVRWPATARVDSGIEEGTVVSPHYDPLLAKIVVHAEDRDEALRELTQTLVSTEILGPRTNLAFLRAVVGDDVVRRGAVTTDWLEPAYRHWQRHAVATNSDDRAVAVAAAAEVGAPRERKTSEPWVSLGSWRGGHEAATLVVVRPEGAEVLVRVAGTGPYSVGPHELARSDDCHGWTVDGRRAAAARTPEGWLVWDGDQYEIAVGPAQRRPTAAAPRLESPLPGQVIAVHVDAGQRVATGDEIVVVEAMKMEHAIRAPVEGVIRAVLCAAGDQVERGQALVDFEPDPST